VWDEAMAIDAWERWIVTGRLAAGRAEMELRLGRLDDAVTWSGRALELATRGRRRKYEVMARIALGRALTARGDVEGATTELGRAVAIADGLGSPLLRWQSRAALAAADRSAEDAAEAAREIIERVAAGLSPERAKAYLSAPPVVGALDLAR
jgi:hypothetical protein